MTDVRCHAKNLYQECWLQDPLLRPTMEEVFNNLESIPIDSATELPILQHLVSIFDIIFSYVGKTNAKTLG